MQYANSVHRFLYTSRRIFSRLFALNMKNLVRINLICLALIAILQLQDSLVSCAPNKNPVCSTPECRKLGTNFKKNLNPNGSPCVDFYDYVCRNWGVQHPRRNSEKMWDVATVMKYRTYYRLKEVLESKRPFYNLDFNRARSLYLGCMNLPFLDKTDSKNIQKAMQQAGPWPMIIPQNAKTAPFSWSAIDNHYIALSGESALFDYGVIINTARSYTIITSVTELFSPYGMVKRTSVWEGPESKYYISYLYNVVKTITSSQLFRAVKAKLQKELIAVLRFREKLRAIADVAEKKKQHQLMSIGEFQRLFDKEVTTKGSQHIDWLSKFQAMYKKSLDAEGAVISPVTMINVNLKYFLPLAKFLATTPDNVIANHIHLYFAERHLKITAQMEQQLRESFIREIFPNGRIRYETERWFTCIDTHTMRRALGKLYVQTYFPQRERENAIRLLKEAQDLLKSQISHSNWLTPEMKTKSIEKVSRMTHQMGYPESYDFDLKNVTSPGNDVDPLTVDAYFIAPLNKIYVSAAYLQPPMFGENFPYAIEYGATVSGLGHELYHAFDTGGIRYNPSGSLNKWWSSDMYKQFNEQRQCFKSQYDAYRKAEMNRLSVNVHTELSDTLEEDQADVMGLKLAYSGYRKVKALKNNVCQVLPGFEKFGCDQMFFIAFANTLCTDSTPATRKMVLISDLHSLEKIRVNGAVANMKEFSDAFGCTENDPLNIQKRCDLWQK